VRIERGVGLWGVEFRGIVGLRALICYPDLGFSKMPNSDILPPNLFISIL